MRSPVFSQAFDLVVDGSESWFDVVLLIDTPLCIDPFLVLDLEEDDEFNGGHAEIINFFNQQYLRLAEASSKSASQVDRLVTSAMRMPEVAQIRLGYGSGIYGSGSGEGLARLMVGGMLTAIEVGLQRVDHFEEISIIHKGIGPDRISDTVANLLKWRLANYTERICSELKIKTTATTLDHAKYDSDSDRWMSIRANLPIPEGYREPVLLVPKKFLRSLPTINSTDFDRFAWHQWNEAHKSDVDRSLTQKVNKHEILERARKNAHARGAFIERAVDHGGIHYDFDKDPFGVAVWGFAEDITNEVNLAIAPPNDLASAHTFVDELIQYFKETVEQRRGWELLWNENGRSKRERAVQQLFFSIAWYLCEQNDISIDPESDLGRGPVDFKLSRGSKFKVMIEIKKSTNTKWFNGVTKQLPEYMKSDKINKGYYVFVFYGKEDQMKIDRLEQVVAEQCKDGAADIELIVIDASPKDTASKL